MRPDSPTLSRTIGTLWKNYNIISRRGFLDRSLKIGMGAWPCPTLVDIPFVMKRALADGNIGLNGKVSVHLSFAARNDALNSVIPVGDPAYTSTNRLAHPYPQRSGTDYSCETGRAIFRSAQRLRLIRRFWLARTLFGSGMDSPHCIPRVEAFLAPVQRWRTGFNPSCRLSETVAVALLDSQNCWGDRNAERAIFPRKVSSTERWSSRVWLASKRCPGCRFNPHCR